MKTLSPVLIAVAVLLLPGGIAATTPVDTLPDRQPRAGGDLAFESSAFLRHTAYQKPDRAADQAAPSGAYPGRPIAIEGIIIETGQIRSTRYHG